MIKGKKVQFEVVPTEVSRTELSKANAGSKRYVNMEEDFRKKKGERKQ